MPTTDRGWVAARALWEIQHPIEEIENGWDNLHEAEKTVAWHDAQAVLLAVDGMSKALILTEDELCQLDFFAHCVPMGVRDDESEMMTQRIRKALLEVRE